jgi:hypothetical protein
MKNLQNLLLNAQHESVKNRLDVNISLALDDKVKQLYEQASVNAQRRLRHKKEVSASQQNTVLIEELTVLLTQHCDKSDLLDPVKYEALSLSVQRWCPWEVESQMSSQLARQLLISMLPQARKKQQLLQICGQFKSHLAADIENGLKDQYPKVYAEYKAQAPQSFGGPTLPTGKPTTLSFDPCRPLDRLLSESASRLKKPSDALSCAITHYRIVRQLEEKLQNPIKLVGRQLQDFRQEFSRQKPVIEKNPDSAAVQFIKRVVNTLSKGLMEKLGFWQVKGQAAAQKIADKLAIPTTLGLKGG